MKSLLHLMRKDAQALQLAWSLWILLVAAQVGLVSKLGGRTHLSPAGLAAVLAAGLLVAAVSVLVARRWPGARARGLSWGLRTVLAAALAALLVNRLAPDTREVQVYHELLLYTTALGAAWLVFAFVLAGLSILNDPAVGTEMFWATRPISGGQLLAAKVCGVALFLVLAPAILWLPWRIHCGFGPVDLLASSLLTTAWTAAAVVPAVVLAAVAGTGARFMVYVIVGALALGSLGLTIATSDSGGSPRIVQSKLLTAALIIAAISATAVVAQYRSRNRTWSIALLLSGVVVGTGAGMLVRSDWLGAALANTTPVDFAASLRWERPKVRVMGYSLDPDRSATLEVGVVVSGHPDGVACGPARATVRLAWPDGRSVVCPETVLSVYGESAPLAVAHNLSIPVYTPDPESHRKFLADRARERGEKGLPPLPLPDEPLVSRETFYSGQCAVDAATAQRLRTSEPSVQVAFHLAYLRPQVALELPLEEGQRRVGHGIAAEVMATELHADVPTGAGKQSISEFQAWLGIERPVERPGLAETDYFFVSRGGPYAGVYRTGYSVRLNEGGPGSLFEGLDRAGVFHRLPQLWRSDHWVEDRGWLNRTTVAVVRMLSAGAAERTVDAEFIPLERGPSLSLSP